MSTPEVATTELPINNENDAKCTPSWWNILNLGVSKQCVTYNKRKAGIGVATGSTAITPVERKDLGSVPAVADEITPPPSGQQAASGQPAGPVPPTKAGGWFSRGGKRKSKAKKSRRKNRKQKKSRKSRK